MNHKCSTSKGPDKPKTSSSEDPLSPEAISALLQPLADFSRLALAVSGGADSMALMRFARIWLNQLQNKSHRAETIYPEIVILTVNHGLRAEAAAEVEFVAGAAAELGFAHAALVWTGDKPKTGVQEAARTARYTLMADFARVHGCGAIVTAHHLNDQAETLLMRLARGSGLDGLAAMAPRSHWGDSSAGGAIILRPLLNTPKSRLVASLIAMGAVWAEDPSNSSERYERTAVRRSLNTSAGLSLAPSALALSARRLGRARAAFETLTEEFAKKALHVHPAGFGEIRLADLAEAPEEIALRALARMALSFGGCSTPPRLAKLETAYQRLIQQAPSGFTLGGCAFTVSNGRLRAYRETGRLNDPGLVLAPGQSAVWDQRFVVTAPEAAPCPLTVRALGEAGVRQARKLHPPSKVIPRLAAESSPGFWLDDPKPDGAKSNGSNLMAAPALDAFAIGSALSCPTPLPQAPLWTVLCKAEFIKNPRV